MRKTSTFFYIEFFTYKHKFFINLFTNDNYDAIRFFFVKCLKISLRDNVIIKIERDDEFQKNEKMLKNRFDFEKTMKKKKKNCISKIEKKNVVIKSNVWAKNCESKKIFEWFFFLWNLLTFWMKNLIITCEKWKNRFFIFFFCVIWKKKFFRKIWTKKMFVWTNIKKNWIFKISKNKSRF